MTAFRRSLILFVFAGAACGPSVESPTDGGFIFKIERTLKILKMDPNVIFVEGGEVISIETENGCRKDSMFLTAFTLPIEQVTEVANDRFTFVAPPSPSPGKRVSVPISMTCLKPWNEASTYSGGRSVAEVALTYDPALEPAPQIKTFAPVTTPLTGAGNISVGARMTVTFTRPILKNTITTQTFKIDGVAGTYTFSDGDEMSGYRAVEFTPNQPFANDHTYTCIVTNGVTNGRKALKIGITPDATATSEVWKFKTGSDGEGP